MSDASRQIDEHISALMDGAVDAQDRPALVRQILASEKGVQVWHAYHLVGDLMRSSEFSCAVKDDAFLRRLSVTLAKTGEVPSGLGDADGSIDTMAIPATPAGPVCDASRAPANGPHWKRTLIVGGMSFVFVGVVGLALWSQQSIPSAGIQVAELGATQAMPALATVDEEGGVMLRDPHLDALMAAHQQFSGHSALPVQSGYLRSATFQGAAQ